MVGLKNIHRHQQGEVKRSVGPQKKHLCLRKKMVFFLLRFEYWEDILQVEEATWITDTITELKLLRMFG